jgi:hypothetical protein
MICVSPPELSDGDLLAYLDGEADTHAKKHLENCPSCRERAQRLARRQSDMTARVYRFDCPSPLELGEYRLDVLSTDRAAGVARHLATCLRCTQEVAQLEGYLADLAPDLELSPWERAGERLQVMVARLVSGGARGDLLAQPAPAHAGLRGREEQALPLIFEAEQVQVVLDVQADPARPGRQTILGLVAGVDDPQAHQVYLWKDSQRMTAVSLDETANFVIPDLAAGRYELILSGPGVEVHVQDVPVGTT